MGLAEIGLQAIMDMADFDKGQQNYKDATASMDSETESLAGKLTGAFSSIGTGVLQLGGVLLGAGVTALVGLGTAAFSAAQEFDDAFDGISIATGAVGPELDGLKEDFKAIFTSVPTDAGSAAEAISALNSRLDLTGETLQGVAEPLLEVTRLTGGDIKTNSESLAGLAQDWGIANEDLAGALDKVFVAAQQTGANFGTLAGQMDQFGPTLKNLGFSFDQAVALMGSLEKAGVNTSAVITGLRGATAKLAETGKPVSEAFADVVTSIKNATTDTEALTIATDIFGTKAGPEMANAIRSGKLELDDLTAILQSSEGAIMETSAATADFGEKWTLLKNKAMVALEPLGMGLMDLATGFVEGITPAATAFIDLLSTTLGPTIESVIGGFGGLMGTGLQGFFEMLIPPLTTLGQWLGENIPVAVATLTNIFQTTVPPVLDFIKQKWGELSGALSDAWEGSLKPAFEDLLGWLKDFLPVAIQKLSDFWTNILGPALDKVWKFVLEVVIPIAADLVAWLIEKIPPAVEFLVKVWNEVFYPAIEAAWAFIRDNLIPIINSLYVWFRDNLPPVIQTLSNFWNNILLPAIRAVWAFIQDNLIPIIVDIWTWIGTNLPPVIQTLTDLWNNVFLPALDAVWAFVKDNLLPIFADIVTWLKDTVPPLIDSVSKLWTETLKPALDAVWKFIKDNVLPIFTDTSDWLRDTVSPLITSVAKLWNETFKPALDAVWKFIQDNLLPIFKTLDEKLGTISTSIGTVSTSISDTFKSALEGVKTFIDVNLNPVLNSMKNKLGDISDKVIDTVSPTLENFKGFLEGFKTAFDNIVLSIQSVITWLGSLATAVTNADWVTVLQMLKDWWTGTTPTPSVLPRLSAPAGERSAMPLSSNGLIPQAQFAGGGGQTLIINMGGQNLYNAMDMATLTSVIDARIRTTFGS